MKEMKKTILAATIAAAACVASAVEAPYAFKSRLSTVHRTDRRDLALAVPAFEDELKRLIDERVKEKIDNYIMKGRNLLTILQQFF